MALGLKDLRPQKKSTDGSGKGSEAGTPVYKKKSLRPWESYNAGGESKTRTVRAHEAALKASERVKDDVFGDYVYSANEQQLPQASPTTLMKTEKIENAEEMHTFNKKTPIIRLAPAKESGGLFSFIKTIFS